MGASGRLFWWGLLLAVVAVTRLVGVSAAPSAGNPGVIKIVSSLPRTGSSKPQTDTIVNGIKIALAEADFRVGDFQLEYVDLDDATAAAGQWTAEAEISNAKQAARDPDVMVYLGTYNSGAAKVSMPILNNARMLMVTPANTWPGLTKPGQGDSGEPQIYRPTGQINYFRVLPADDLQALRSAQWAKELGVRRVYVLDDNEVYGQGIANLFIRFCTKRKSIGIEILGHESIDVKAQEFKSLMTKIKALNPDMVYFGGMTQTRGGQIAKDMVAAGLDCKLMVPDACYEQAFITAAGADNLNDRCYVTFGGLPPERLPGPGKRFVEAYRKRFNSEPEAYAIYGYEAAKVALEAIRLAGKKDRQAIVDACASIHEFEKGALGKWSFDSNGDTNLETISGNTIHDGKFQFVKLLGK